MLVGDVLAGSMIADQIELETESVSEGVARYRRLVQEAVERGDAASLKPAERLILYWFEPLVFAIKEEQRKISRQVKGEPGRTGNLIYGPVLWKLDADRLAVITLNQMLSTCLANTSGQLVLKLTYAIGNSVLAEINHDMMRVDHTADLKELDRRFKRITPARVNRWAKQTLEDPIWQRTVCTQVGAILMHLAAAVCKIEVEEKGKENEFQPAFVIEKQWRDNKPKGCCRLSSECLQLVEDGHMFRQHLRPKFGPMIVQPYAWTDETEGGYARLRTPFITKPTKEQKRALQEDNVETLFEAVNAINATSWKYNAPIVNVFRQIWDSGGGIPGIPRADVIPLPPKPANIESDPEVLKAWKAEAHEVHSANAKLRGARIEFIQRLTEAERYLQYDELWFPHFLDFRTRTYPIPATCPTHHGDDICRAMLLFARRVPLTDRGRWWIHVQSANMYGYDKLSFDDRYQWTLSQMEMIRAIANDPIGTIDTWTKAAEPGQFLASCFALVDDSIGECYPVQLDGTFNGNQHLAAAGRCSVAAPALNMTKASSSDAPNDSYLDVLEETNRRVMNDAAGGNEAAKKSAILIEEKDQGRKIIKQPSMTTIYHVTRVGARNQIKKTLQKIGVKKESQYEISHYLSATVMDSVGGVFEKATEIMQWIETCARMMVKSQPNRALKWYTPIGAPVIQPYRNIRKFKVRTVVQNVILGHRDEEAPVSLAKQVQASIPNIVHCWDGTHWQCVALMAKDEDIDTAGVHDSIWFHASNADRGGEIIRITFVSMHEEDQCMALWEYWSEQYPELDLPKPPARGDFDLNEVLMAPYFFS